MEKQKGMARGTDGWPGSANSRFDQEPRRATKFAKFHSEKRALTEHIAKKMSDKQQSHPLRRLLPPFSGKKMISSETKREMKAKDDKMLTLERYFESCRRDLSRCLSWTK